MKNIWTIGHSTRSIEEFLKLLKSFGIRMLVDIRTYPGSKRYPHFNKDSLQDYLSANDIDYVHIPALGGRRKPLSNSPHVVWRNSSFRGYADHMDTKEFQNAILDIEALATEHNLAYMCSEAMWWKCHRALMSDYLKQRGWKVNHIENEGKSKEHPYTEPARQMQGKLFPD